MYYLNLGYHIQEIIWRNYNFYMTLLSKLHFKEFFSIKCIEFAHGLSYPKK